MQNLLGINNALRAAGFWTDNAGHEHGFVAEINTQTTPVSARFRELTPAKVSADLGVNAVATQTSDITNGAGSNLVCGFWTDANNNNHGFEVFFNTATHSFNMVLPFTANPAQIPNVESLSPFGCNDHGAVVGTYTANNGTVHGFVFDGKIGTITMPPVRRNKQQWEREGYYHQWDQQCRHYRRVFFRWSERERVRGLRACSINRKGLARMSGKGRLEPFDERNPATASVASAMPVRSPSTFARRGYIEPVAGHQAASSRVKVESSIAAWLGRSILVITQIAVGSTLCPMSTPTQCASTGPSFPASCDR